VLHNKLPELCEFEILAVACEWSPSANNLNGLSMLVASVRDAGLEPARLGHWAWRRISLFLLRPEYANPVTKNNRLRGVQSKGPAVHTFTISCIRAAKCILLM
jgi:hypothetical protein